MDYKASTETIGVESVFSSYNGEDVFLICALDSIGVPYTIDNVEMKSFADIIREQFVNSGAKVSYINMCNLARNKTWELKDYLSKDKTKGEIYKLHQKFAEIVVNDKSPEARFNHPTNPNFVDRYYSNVEEPDLRITTKLRESPNPIFLFSCGGMDIDYYFKMPSCSVSLIAKEALTMANVHVKKVLQNVDDCFALILDLNPKTEIYVLGTYPMIENKSVRKIAQPLYRYYNRKLEEVCHKHDNIHYVDIFGTKEYIAENDNHPTYEGQKYIAATVFKEIEQQKNNMRKK